jgi:hypothetical protein
MKARNPGRAGAARCDGAHSNDATSNLTTARIPDKSQPIERHDPLCDDKVALFEVRVPTWMLLRLAEHFRRPPVRGALP